MKFKRELVWSIGELNPGEYWIMDDFSGVQVGWVTRSDEDSKWYIYDSGYGIKAGPFQTYDEAYAQVEEVLGDAFGIGSPAN